MTAKTPALLLALTAAACLSLAGCGPGKSDTAGKGKGYVAGAPAQVGETYNGVGVLAAEKWPMLTIDAEAVPAAGLTAGRHDFRAFADVIAESPGAPGARVAFSFRKDEKGGLQLTALKAR
jgi:hypothetical protein